MREYTIYILTALFPLLTACNSDDPLPNGGESPVTPSFAISTRGGTVAADEVTTYRLLCYSLEGIYLGDTYKYNGKEYYYGTGTYYLPAGGNTLIPCTVDADGGFVKDMSLDEEDMNNSPAIHGTLDNVLVACVRPAVKNNDGTISYNPRDPFYCSMAEPVNVTGYGTVKLTEPLLDQRARIVVRIYKGADALSDFTMPAENIDLMGMGGEDDHVGFNPGNRGITVYAGSENASRTFDLTEATGGAGTGGDVLRYFMEDCFVPAADYSIQDSPQLIFTLGIQREGTDNPVTVPVRITNITNSSGSIKEFKPETVYIYNIILSSTYYGLSVDIMDWTEEDLNTGIGTYGTTINFGSFSYGEDGGGWTDVPVEPDYPAIGEHPDL